MTHRRIPLLLVAALVGCASGQSRNLNSSIYLSDIRHAPGSAPAARQTLLNSLVMHGGYAEIISDHTSRVTEQGEGTPIFTVTQPISEVPFQQALALVMPADWKAYVSGDIAMDTPVMWDQVPFPATVDSIVRAVDATAFVDWDLQIVRVDPIDVKPHRTRLGEHSREPAALQPGIAVYEPLLPDVFDGEQVRVNQANAKLEQIVHALVPPNYEVHLDLPPGVADQRLDVLVETTRGRALQDLENQLGLRIIPYHRHRLIVVTATES